MTHMITRMLAGAVLIAGSALPVLADQGKMVTLADVTQGDAAANIWVSGTVASRQQAALSAEVSGRVEWIAEFGSRVKKGDELLRLDIYGVFLLKLSCYCNGLIHLVAQHNPSSFFS